MEITKDIVVLYHGNCPDGFTAAWAAWKKFGDAAEYVGLHRYAEFPKITGKEVYLLDYCPNQKEVLLELNENNKKLIVIDHHISEVETIKLIPGYVFDVRHSGAVLAWNFFHPDTAVPALALYIEDRDIWNWKLPHTQEILNVVDLSLDEYDFYAWNRIARDLDDESEKNKYIAQGATIQKFRQRVIENIIKNQTQTVMFEGYEIYAANAPRFFVSEVGGQLALKKPPFAIVWSQTEKKIVISMRAVDGFDATVISKKYGGGGHKGAASFSLPTGDSFPWAVISEDNETHD